MNEQDLYMLHKNMIRSLSAGYARHPAIRRDASLDANDLYQEGCIAFLQAARTYNANGNVKFTTYLTRVCHNHLRNTIRTMTSQSRSYSKDSPHLPEEYLDRLPAHDYLNDLEMVEAIRKSAQAHLPAEDAQILMAFCGVAENTDTAITEQELADMFDMTRSQIRTRIQRSLSNENFIRSLGYD